MNNKSKKIFFLILIILFSITSLYALELTIEDSNLISIPKNIADTIRIFDSDYSECEYIGKSIQLDADASNTFWFVTTQDACGWGNALGPIWVLEKKSESFEVILGEGGFSLFIEKSISNRLFDIKTTAATAGWFQENYWKYDGKKYQKFTLKDNPNEKVLLSVIIQANFIEKSKDILKIVELTGGKKKLKAFLYSLHRIEELSKEFSANTKFSNVRFLDRQNSPIVVFSANDDEWTVKYCWDVSSKDLYFAAKKAESKRIYYSKNLDNTSQCLGFIRN